MAKAEVKVDAVEAEGTEVLPAAGDEQREILKKRKDRLDQIAEERAALAEHYTLDPSAFEIENEIAQHFNVLAVTNRVSGYRYVWANFLSANGRGVTYKLAKRVNGQPVWEVVRGDMPENRENVAVDGTRRIGDVLLMRAKEDLAQALDKYEEQKKRAREQAVTNDLIALGEKYASKGVHVTTGEQMDERTFKRMQTNAEAMNRASRMQDRWLREGRMPGMAGH